MKGLLVLFILFTLFGCATDGDTYKMVCDEIGPRGEKQCHLERAPRHPFDDMDRK